MGTVFMVVFCVVTAVLAGRKGCNPALWFLAAGVIGLLILAFLPFVNEKSKQPTAERASKKVRGDVIGAVLSGLAVIVLLMGLITS